MQFREADMPRRDFEVALTTARRFRLTPLAASVCGLQDDFERGIHVGVRMCLPYSFSNRHVSEELFKLLFKRHSMAHGCSASDA